MSHSIPIASNNDMTRHFIVSFFREVELDA